MIKNKQLQKLVNKLVEISFKDGKMVESQITKSIKALKSLPRYQSIESLSEYLKNLKREERKYTMFIEAAIPLSNAQLRKMKKIVEKKNKITKIVTSINSEILGGFKLKIGDEIWDESILEKVNQVKEVITGGRSN